MLSILPSFMWAIRSPKAKTRLSWVTTTRARSGRTAAAQELHDSRAGFVIERRGRLVTYQKRRIVDQGARDRDALHLAAGELARQALLPRAHTDRSENLAGPLHRTVARPTGDNQGNRRVLGSRESR